MYISGLMNSKSEFKLFVLISFPRRGGYEFAFQCFLGSNEEKWVAKRRKRFYCEVWGNTVWEGGACENPVALSVGENLVHATFDCWILSQNWRNTLTWHTFDKLVESAWNGMLMWLAGINYVKVRTRCKAQHLMAHHGKVRIYIIKVELKMDASQTVKEWKCWVLT